MQNNLHQRYCELRRQYPLFTYRAYHWQRTSAGLELSFDFCLGEEHLFCPTALIEHRPFLNFDCPDTLLDMLAFNIGMVELVSYWKCACSPTVRVECGALDADQLAFWRKLYWHGLGEFFYTNGIEADSDSFMHIECSGTPFAKQPCTLGHPMGYLVPVGGGKDSVVSLEMLRRSGQQLRPLVMNPRGATVECASKAGFDMSEVLVIRRTIHPHLLELNAQGYLNGHTPFSAMLAFYTLLASTLSGMPNIALSNESSANEATVIGSSVNHQYSKSLEFENDFRAYSRALFSGDTPNYFSLLRPMSELMIARQFARLGADYFDVFRSCNVGSKQDIWCGHCAKCLFAYIILSPFVPQQRLAQMFGRNMLDQTALRHEFDQLTGQAPTKPFECVGTVGEVNTALALTHARLRNEGAPLPALLADYRPSAPDLSLFTLAPDHNLSPLELGILQSQCSGTTN